MKLRPTFNIEESILNSDFVEVEYMVNSHFYWIGPWAVLQMREKNVRTQSSSNQQLSDGARIIEICSKCDNSQKMLIFDLVTWIYLGLNWLKIVQPSAILDILPIRMDKLIDCAMFCPIFKTVCPICWTVCPFSAVFVTSPLYLLYYREYSDACRWSSLQHRRMSNATPPAIKDLFSIQSPSCDVRILCVVCGFGSLQNKLLGESAGGGSMAVAVDFSDRWQVIGDSWKVTPDTWHVTCDIRHLTHDTYFFGPFLSILLCFCDGATICTHAEIQQCLRYAGFSLNRPHWADSVTESPYPCVVLRHWVQFFSRPLIGPQVT